MEKARVKNTPSSGIKYRYTIIRDCEDYDGEGRYYWYYGADDDVTTCSRIAAEIRNGLVVETEKVEAI